TSHSKSLIRVPWRASETHGSLWKFECILVPLEDLEVSRKATEHWIAPRRFRQEDRIQPELRRWATVDLRLERRRKELSAKANSEVRDAGFDCLLNEPLLPDEPRMFDLLIDAHWTAHGDDQVVVSPVGEFLSLRD